MIFTLIAVYSLLVGIGYWLLLTARKHNFNLAYENWYDKLSDTLFVKKVLPKDFCQLCFVTQSTLMVSVIVCLLLQMPLWSIIILTPSASGMIMYLDSTSINYD